jgi:predicted kinase
VYVRVNAADEDVRARLGSRRKARAPDDHSDADETVYERMRAQTFEPPAEGHLELVNGPELEAEIARVSIQIEAASR